MLINSLTSAFDLRRADACGDPGTVLHHAVPESQVEFSTKAAPDKTSAIPLSNQNKVAKWLLISLTLLRKRGIGTNEKCTKTSR